MLVKYETNFADGFDGDIVLRLVFSGCKKGANGRPCKNCHNPGLWGFDLKSENIYKDLERQLAEWKEDMAEFTIISVIGGEPLDQDPEEAQKVLDIVGKYYDVPVLVYTGKTEEEVFCGELSKHPFVASAGYIKCGPYIEELAPEEEEYNAQPLPKLASVNQVIYSITRDGETTKIKKIR